MGRWLLVGALLLTSVVAAEPAVARPVGAPPTPRHGAGLALPAERVLPTSRMRAFAQQPASVDLTRWAVPPGDQGSLNSCTSWSVGYTLTGWWASRAGKPAAFAPMYLYSQTHLSDASDGGGAYLADAFRIEAAQGIDTRSHYAHDVADFTTQPSAAERANAAAYRIGSMQRLYAGAGAAASGGRQAIMSAIAAGRPVVLGIPYFDAFASLDAADHRFTAADATGARSGYHAVVVLGYDADGVTIENSWGDDWGDHGFAQLGWDFVTGYSTEADTTTGPAAAPPDTGVPSWPTAVGTAATASSVTLSWQPPASTGGAVVTGYRVTRDGQDTGRTGPRTADVSAATRWVTFADLFPGSRYRVTVQALTAAGTGETATATATTTAATVPGAPSDLRVTPHADGTTIDVAWVPPADDGGAAVTAVRAVISGGGRTVTRSLPAASPALGLDGLEPGTAYTLTASAVTSIGSGPAAVVAFATPAAPAPGTPPVGLPGGSTTATPEPGRSTPTVGAAVPARAPAAPSRASASGTARAIVLRWSPPVTTGGRPVTGYRVTRSSTDAQHRAFAPRTVRPSVRVLRLTGLRRHHAYTVTLRAITAAGVGARVVLRVRTS